MNRCRCIWTLLIIAIFLVLTTYAPVASRADKVRPIEIADTDSWKSISSASLSEDGKWFAYILKPAKGDAELVLRRAVEDQESETENAGDAKKVEQEKRYPIGAVSGGRLAFSADSKWLAFVVYPNEKAAQQAKDAKKPLATKVVIVCLESDEKLEIENARSFTFSGEQAGWIAIRLVSSASSAPAKEKAAGADLLLHEMATGRQLNIGNVSEFAFNKSGAWLAIVIDAAGKAGNGVQLHNLATGVVQPIESGKAKYSKLSWNKDGDALAVLKGVEDDKYEHPLQSIVAWKKFDLAQPQKTVFDPQKQEGFPEGMTVSPNRSPSWTADLAMLLFGIHDAKLKKEAEANGKKDETAKGEKSARDKEKEESAKKQSDPKEGDQKPAPGKTKKGDEKPAELVIWHWQDKRLQSQQQKEAGRDKTFSFLCTFSVESGKFVQLANEALRNVVMAPKHQWAVGLDDAPYRLDASLDGRRYQDIHVIDPRSGERWLAVKKCRWYFGSSSDANRLLYYDDGHYYTYDIALRKSCQITKDVPVSFVNTEDDHNQIKPPIRPYGWSADGASVLLNDNWDIWNVPANGGQATNLTENGRKDKIRYRRPFRLDPDQEGVDLGHDMYVAAYGEWTKKAGIGLIKPGGTGVKMLMWDDAQYSRLLKARRADVFLYTRETNQEYPDYYVADATLKGKRITDANAQQEQFAWSAGSRLVDFTSADGDKLQAALFLPAGYRNGRQYPTIVYIYEKLSSRLNRYSTPRIGGFSPSLYTSQGYAVLMPDITYKINAPGLSAVGCVLPALQAAVKTGVVDPEHVGLQGHSWGGYQTAFLVTQTDKFAAAVAGAPLTNLISMYSSIYWNSGSANQPIFENSQGRFTTGYWENLAAYTRNSPVYFATQIKTPLLLLHNDEDGAVDWNQGIEYFNALRRLKKPVVMLQYKGENHGLAKRENRRDYSVRMLEFFDHYLKEKPAPKWWTDGIPHLDLPDYLKEQAKVRSSPKGKK